MSIGKVSENIASPPECIGGTVQQGWVRAHKTLKGVRGTTLAAALAVAAVAAGSQLSAQSWTESRAAVDSCVQELEFRISRETQGRAPTAGIDFQSLQVRQSGRNALAVNGRGSFRRDQFDRGRAYTFACTYDASAGRANVTYKWSTGATGGNFDEPGYSTLPSYVPVPGGPGSGGSSAYPPTGRVFFSGGIINRASGKGLDVEAESRTNAANVQQWDFGSKPNQTWDIVDLGRGEFSIVNQGSGMALDVARRDGSDGANVQQFRWHNGDNQRWRLERAGGGFYQIVSVSSGRCLDVDAGRLRENGANVQQWSCSGQPNQQWRLGR
jgi:hypothetical protein